MPYRMQGREIYLSRHPGSETTVENNTIWDLKAL